LATSSNPGTVARFSGFELDLDNGELRRDGAPLKLQPQPAKLLALLVSRAGEVVTRDELAKLVWGSETFVDFEHGLNFAIRQIRTTLGDDADRPRFLETVPRRGYRFIAPLEQMPPAPGKSKPVSWGGSHTAAVLCVALLVGVAVYLAWPPSKPPLPPRATVLAVLPFDDLSPEPEEYLVEGLTEEMIAQLTRISPDLKVIARTSAMQYLHTKKSAREIGQELGADYILENSIRHEGSRLRITAQLVRTADQTHLWAENYDREMRELLPLESEVTEDIANQIHVRLSSPVAAAATSRRPVDPEAHQFYLKGRYYFNQRSREGLENSVKSFAQAIAKDPHYAPAYAGLADAYNLIAFYGFDPSLDAVTQAKISADKALHLDDSMAAAHAALAYTDFMYGGDWPAAEREFRRALELDDNYVPAHQWYALYLAGNGRVDEAVGQMRYAQKLDPLSPPVQAGLGYMYYFARDYDLAAEHAHVALQLNPNFTAAHAVLGWADLQQKKYAEAIEELQTATKLSGSVPVYLCALGRAYALSGNLPEARRIAVQSEKMEAEPNGAGTSLAALYLALGDSERALHWLEITGPGDVQANWLRVEPAFDPLRDSPRFAAVLARTGAKKE
jgi:TolB-like protein/DNA-binding winged helix-turn-helix (wHTH) protein/Flp pilus assembly protein TadD